jgi:hypothetical protein
MSTPTLVGELGHGAAHSHFGVIRVRREHVL